ncbi:MAG: hypothetical protein H6670_14840 [Anaerolineaceae bacterium]|nr:hypothetical protein [Anaerolineaceae bacterium]
MMGLFFIWIAMSLVVKVKTVIFLGIVASLTIVPFVVYLVLPLAELIVATILISIPLLLGCVLVVTKSPRCRALLTAFVVILIGAQVLFYSDANLQHRIICSTSGRHSVADLVHSEDSVGASFTLCGNLHSCDVLELENAERYEVCLIEDVADRQIGTVYVNQRIIYSPDGDPLVQMFYDLDFLRFQDAGTLIIRGSAVVDVQSKCLDYAIANPFAECSVTYSTEGLKRSLGG